MKCTGEHCGDAKVRQEKGKGQFQGWTLWICTHCGQVVRTRKDVVKRSFGINAEQRLYVIPEAGGWSCLGFDVCEKRTVALAKELEAKGHHVGAAKPIGTPAHYFRYRDLCNLALKEHAATGWRSSSALTPALIGREGKRVEVRHQWKSGEIETARFNVGKSSGYIPVHLQLHNSRSTGGSAVCLGEIISVREV